MNTRWIKTNARIWSIIAERRPLVVIYNVLNLSREENHYDTIPLTFIVRQNQIVTISNAQNEYIIDQIREELEENMHWSVFNFLLHSLFPISENYFPIIETLNKEQQNISKLLRKKTTKDNLFRLSDLEIEGMYLVSATKQKCGSTRATEDATSLQGTRRF